MLQMIWAETCRQSFRFRLFFVWEFFISKLAIDSIHFEEDPLLLVLIRYTNNS